MYWDTRNTRNTHTLNAVKLSTRCSKSITHTFRVDQKTGRLVLQNTFFFSILIFFFTYTNTLTTTTAHIFLKNTMSFPWNNEEEQPRKGKQQVRQNAGSNIFGSASPVVERTKAPLQPSSYNIISGDGNSASAVDRQPRKVQWNASDYIVQKGKGAVAQNEQFSFDGQAQHTQQNDRFERAPKCGDFNSNQSTAAYVSNRRTAAALKNRTQQSEAGACIFGN